MQNTVRKSWTWIGLVVALLSMPIVTLVFRALVPGSPPAGLIALREIIIFLLLGLLLGIIRRGERLPFRSIGWRSGGNGRSLLWGLLAFLLLDIVTFGALGLLPLLGLSYGEGHAPRPPLWASFLVVLRAGIVEEMFYRGYAMERIEGLTKSRVAAVLIPLIAFASFHYRQGVAGVVVALLLGALLAGFYLWRRDLKANIVGHFLIDFIPNVLLPMLSG